MKIYITSDKISGDTGAGKVCDNELLALRNLDREDTLLINPDPNEDPFKTDEETLEELKNHNIDKATIAHFYAGTYPKTVKYLKERNIKVSYTAAAHNRKESIKEHESFGLQLPKHVTDDEEFSKYVAPYVATDLVICPSIHSADQMKMYGCKNVDIIPHGVYPMRAKPYPKTFNVGYLGQIGPDKGLKYLLEAWAMLNYKTAVLNLAGAQTPYVLNLIRYYGVGNVIIHGWVENIEDYYNSLSIYVQPSVTEGFGIETLEALACGKPVICSEGAGSADVVGDYFPTFEPRDSKKLAENIDKARQMQFNDELSIKCQQISNVYNWNLIREKYIAAWKNLRGDE